MIKASHAFAPGGSEAIEIALKLARVAAGLATLDVIAEAGLVERAAS